MWRLFGLRQRIVAIMAGGTIVAAAIVGQCLYEISVVRDQSQAERMARQRGDSVHMLVIVAMQAATVFSSLALDLDAEEKKQAIEQGNALLQQLVTRKSQLMPLLTRLLDTGDREALDESVGSIGRAWNEMQDELQAGERAELLFHIVAVVNHAERIREIVAKADAKTSAEARNAAALLDWRVANARRLIVVAALAGGLLLFVIGGLLLHFGVKRPLSEVIAAVSRIAKGDIATPVRPRSTADEIGQILSALEFLRQHAAARVQLENERARGIAERDARREALESLVAGFRAAVLTALNENRTAMVAMRRATKSLAAAAVDTQAGGSQASTASREVSGNVAEMATATQQLNESIGSLAFSAERAETAISEGANRATLAAATITKLSDTAQSIAAVASSIDSIARQTNLLALNATIEAARAGAYGRGFSVVAGEVKSLAAQTASATKIISDRVKEVRSRTAEAVEAIGVITATNAEVTRHAATIAAAVTEQSQVTGAISKNVHDAAGWTAGLAATVDEVAAAILRTKQAAEEVDLASVESAFAVDQFNQLVDDFLDKVRAADSATETPAAA